MSLLRLLPIAALGRPQDLAFRQRLQVVGDLPHPLVQRLRQLIGRGALDGTPQVSVEDLPAHGVADGADQL
jgi:hypothetical protein